MDSEGRHAAPPPDMKRVFKRYQKLKTIKEVDMDLDLIDSGKDTDQTHNDRIMSVGSLPSEKLLRTFQSFAGDSLGALEVQDALVYAHKVLPGLLTIPALLPPEVQRLMLQRLLHRDLSDPKHQTNLHLHYNIPYQYRETRFADKRTETPSASFFSLAPDSSIKFVPKDPSVHKPLSISQVMEKKLRWVTLGGQYDWTSKLYPSEKPPEFPADLAALIEGLFPAMKAQAAIVNMYSPGDTLSLHRDVSEECDRPLVSISLGCDCIFLVGLEKRSQDSPEEKELPPSAYIAIRLRSGDAVYMSQEARFAWHGVPKILASTCPSYLEDWPAGSDGQIAGWKGWMQNKRINLNVRQMFELPPEKTLALPVPYLPK